MTNKMNVKLLRKVKRHILEEPKRLDMTIFCTTKMGRYEKMRRPDCGTVACIAGWAVLLDRLEQGRPLPKKITHQFYAAIESKAAQLLGLNEKQKDKLFFWPEWPSVFHNAFLYADTPREEARIAAKRIEHFIKTGE